MSATATMPQAAAQRVPTKHLVAFFFMVFGMFMAILDIQIVSSSLAEIQAGISASADEIPWVQTSYLIAEVVMIPLSGTLTRIFSTRWLFVAAAARTQTRGADHSAKRPDQVVEEPRHVGRGVGPVICHRREHGSREPRLDLRFAQRVHQSRRFLG